MAAITTADLATVVVHPTRRGELLALSPCPHGFIYDCDEGCGLLENRVAQITNLETSAGGNPARSTTPTRLPGAPRGGRKPPS